MSSRSRSRLLSHKALVAIQSPRMQAFRAV